ncbi:hypothetical protein BDW74DRAFT_154041 [Aspergillus multicolor]|uniref:uncharacterized protein n=1 Tax=Aspergillus multicolor TaxID=41759 RepID=UPI003CCDD943
MSALRHWQQNLRPDHIQSYRRGLKHKEKERATRKRGPFNTPMLLRLPPNESVLRLLWSIVPLMVAAYACS